MTSRDELGALARGTNARQAARVHSISDALPHLRGCGLQYAADRTDLRRYFTHARTRPVCGVLVVVVDDFAVTNVRVA